MGCILQVSALVRPHPHTRASCRHARARINLFPSRRLCACECVRACVHVRPSLPPSVRPSVRVCARVRVCTHIVYICVQELRSPSASPSTPCATASQVESLCVSSAAALLEMLACCKDAGGEDGRASGVGGVSTAADESGGRTDEEGEGGTAGAAAQARQPVQQARQPVQQARQRVQQACRSLPTEERTRSSQRPGSAGWQAASCSVFE